MLYYNQKLTQGELAMVILGAALISAGAAMLFVIKVNSEKNL